MKGYQTPKTFGLALLGVVFCLVSATPARAEDAVRLTGARDPAALKVPEVISPEIWKDPTQPLNARVHDLVSRMSLAEKVSQMDCVTPAIPRLGIPAYSYRNECLHGRRTANIADFNTVFPQAIGMAATWDLPLIHDEADVISTECRAAHNDYAKKHDGDSTNSFGLTCYTPNINIFRDPRWGRGQETYGEDPFLTAQTAVAFIDGLQGDDPRYIKIMACAKHFAVHSGPEPDRHRLNAAPPERDLYETYLPAFEAAVRESHVGSVMGAYSSLYGVPDCANHFLLTDLLRKQWGFDGFVVSDGSAIVFLWKAHKYVATLPEAAAAAVKAGCDLSSGAGHNGYGELPHAIQKGLISEDAIDAAVSRDLASRFRVGLFDPPSMVPWSKITLADNNTPEHRALALKVAEESIVLLKNNGLLPLNRAKIKNIAVIGPNADSVTALLGSYNGNPSQTVTILDGIKAMAGTNIEVTYTPGCPLALKTDNSNQPTSEMTAQAITAAKFADVVIYVGGIDSTLENEENHNSRKDYQGFDSGDRTRIELPSPQEDLLKALHATGKPVIFVNCSGSAMAMTWEAEHLPAIVQAWYPGEEGGQAVGEILFGDVNPFGRLPITFYNSTKDLPDFEDYSMSNRTYRYFNGKPLFAFGHGLSYTKFSYKKPRLDRSTYTAGDIVKVSFKLKNSGARTGDEVAQVYFRHVKSSVSQAKLALCGFTRVHLAKGNTVNVTVDIPSERFRYWDTAKGQYVVEPGEYQLLIGGASDDIQLNEPFKIVGMAGTGAGATSFAQDTNQAVNTALIPVPRSTPTNWLACHEGFVEQAKRDRIDLLFIGDSITACWRWTAPRYGSNVLEKYYAPRHAADFGIGGDRTQHVLWRIEHGELDGLHPKVTVLMIGTNNGKDNSPPEIADAIKVIIREIHAKCPGTKILLLGVFPRNRPTDTLAQIEAPAKINAIISSYDDGKTIRYLNINDKFIGADGRVPASIMPDFVHPNEHGYQIWADAMEPTLARMMK